MVKETEVTKEKSEGGITSAYATGDQWWPKIKVPYLFFGSIFDEEEEKAVLAAMKQDSLTMGANTAAFQKEFAAYTGVKHAFATTSCTTAMHVATQVFNINAGDEVIVTPNTFIATSLVILKEGAIPVYVDIDPKTYNIDPNKIEAKITPKTKAIYVVHYAGLMCDMDPIMEIARKHNLYVLEDCAHAPGAEYKGRKAGSIGDIGCFSFHSLKNMTTLGEGGMITTNRDDFVKPISMLRCMNLQEWSEHKRTEDYWYPSHFDVDDVNGKWGCNYRMNECQAAVGRTQLKKLDMLSAKRQEIGRYITNGLKGVEGIEITSEVENSKHVYHLYTVCVKEEILGVDRDTFLRVLYREEGVQGILHYEPNYMFTGLQKTGRYKKGDCPIAEKFFYKEQFNVPMHPRLTKQEQNDIIEGLKNTVKKVKK
ncbi:MAG: DegT/DnrJ/EryC1/StrS family aminotransferase [bacterium]